MCWKLDFGYWDFPAATSGDQVSSSEAVDAKLPMQSVVHTILSLPRSAPGSGLPGAEKDAIESEVGRDGES